MFKIKNNKLQIETPINNLSNSLFNFISNVPMDKDMEIKHFDI